MKKIKLFAILLSIAMVLTMFPVVTMAEGDVDYLYRDESGVLQTGTKSADEYTTVVNETTQLSDGWYVASDFLYIYNRVEVSGDVHLILADNCDVTFVTVFMCRSLPR